MSLRDRLAKTAWYENVWLGKRDDLDREYTQQSDNWAANMVAQARWHKRQVAVDRELSRRIKRIRMMA